VTTVNATSLRQPEFLKPRYWPTWVGIGLIRLICVLPLRARWALGSALGLLAFYLARKRRHIVLTNLALCFPHADIQTRQRMLIENFRSSGISIIETAVAWFEEPAGYRTLVDIEGLENLRAAKAEGRGVLLLGMHLSTLDFCGAVLASETPFDVMYRRNKNKLLEAVMTRGRQRNFDSAIERNNVRQVIRRLKEGAIVWYGPDQDYGRRHSVFAPFFSRQAATITATSRIVKITGSPVVVFSHYRDLQQGRYRIRLERLDDFPAGDDLIDCTLINSIVEKAISEAPEQYWWLHRRFKTQPEGIDRPY